MVKKKSHRNIKKHGHAEQTNALGQRFAAALRLHEQGKLSEAESRYREILQAHSRHFDTLLCLGHLYLHSGRTELAIEITTRAIGENQDHPVAHFNLGLAYINLGKSELAIKSFDRAIALMPGYADAHCNRGIALQNLGQHREAITSFDRAIEAAHNNGLAYNNRGISLQKLGQHQEAIANFDQAITLLPNHGAIYNNRGISFLVLRKYPEALASFERAIALKPDYAEAYNNYGLALQHLGRNLEAIQSIDKALALSSDSGMAHSNRGVALLKLGRMDEALANLDEALGESPDSAEIFNHRGMALQKAERFEEALICFNQALALHQTHAGALNNRGNLLRSLNRNIEALASYEEALRVAPDDASTHLNVSLSRLLLGDFARGWEEFEWRWQTSQYRDAQKIFPEPLWLGKESLLGKTILLHAEQGIGDTIQFCRYGSQVAALGATVIIEVQPELKPALLGLGCVVLARGEALPPFDYHCPIMSLPLALHTDLAHIPAMWTGSRYLECDTERVSHWRNILGATTLPRIGLAWSGNADFANDRNRSIPLATFANLQSDRAQFISLQRDIRPTDQTALESHQEIRHFGNQLRDFSDTAALIENMDLVISVDTAVAHLAGALGKPVWIVLPVNSDWRWLLDREDTPWYPSARLFRQSRLGDWGPVIASIAADIGPHLKHPNT